MKKFCTQCGNEVEGTFCSNCGAKVNNIEGEMLESKPMLEVKPKKSKAKKIILGIVGVFGALIISLIIIGIFAGSSEPTASNQVQSEEEIAQEENANNANEDNDTIQNNNNTGVEEGVLNANYSKRSAYTELQKQAIALNDNVRTISYENELLARNPDALEGIPLVLDEVEIHVITKNTDTEFECIAGTTTHWLELGEEAQYVYLVSEQFDTRLLEGDIIYATGTFLGMTEIMVNDQPKYVPAVEVDINRTGYIYGRSEEEVKQIVDTILGSGVELAPNDYSEGYDGVFGNLSNADLQGIFISSSLPPAYSMSKIGVWDKMGNCNPVFPAADFEHFYYLGLSDNDNFEQDYYYDMADTNLIDIISYYDHENNKLWERELTGGKKAYINYDLENLYVSYANKLFVIDNETGEDVREPISVGTTGEIYKDADGIFITDNANDRVQTDCFMKISNEGEIIWSVSMLDEFGGVNIIHVTENEVFLYAWGDGEHTIGEVIAIYDKESGELIDVLDTTI